MLTSEQREIRSPFPRLPRTIDLECDPGSLSLGAFGQRESDLNIDFDRTARPFLITNILECCTASSGRQVDQRFFWSLSVGSRIECLLLILNSSGWLEIPVLVRCPDTGCGRESEIEISV